MGGGLCPVWTSEPPTYGAETYGAEPHLNPFRDPQPTGLSPTLTHSKPPNLWGWVPPQPIQSPPTNLAEPPNLWG